MSRSDRMWFSARQAVARHEKAKYGYMPTWRHDTLRRRVQEAADYRLLDRRFRKDNTDLYSLSTKGRDALKKARKQGTVVVARPPKVLEDGTLKQFKKKLKVQMREPTDLMVMLLWYEDNT